MSLLALPAIERWLSQFEIPERYLAEYMLKKMRYVSFEEVEAWIQTALRQLISDIETTSGKKEAIAIFPVSKPFIHNFNEDKEIKPANDSAGRFAHSLRNVERDLSKHIELTPRLESMRDRKVRHLIFVDDFIGTGDRFISSWREMVHRSIKSWCSRGWCKVWIISYAGHKKGKNRIISKVGPVTHDCFRIFHEVDESFIWENDGLARLCWKYSAAANEGKKSRLGYGDLLSPIIFQYGCPNNAPAILWCKHIKNSEIKWKPLFPNRSIPVDLYPAFGVDHSAEATSEDLWMARHYKVALEIINRPHDFGRNHALVSILAYLNQGKSLERIRRIMVMTDEEFGGTINDLIEYGLISHLHMVTRFGKDVLKRGGREKKQMLADNSTNTNYYPATFLGFQRET